MENARANRLYPLQVYCGELEGEVWCAGAIECAQDIKLTPFNKEKKRSLNAARIRESYQNTSN
jgi:hypothetical protein